MATLNEAIVKWINRPRDHERTIGRYWATDLFKIRKGYLKPKDFFNYKEISKDETVELVTRGIAMEDFILKVFTDLKAKVKYHQKIEFKVNDEITLSGEMDFLFPDKVIECKYPRERCYALPDRYIDQCSFYHKATGLDTYLCEFPYPTRMWKLEFDKKRWEETMDMVKSFHEKLINLKNNG